MEITHVLTVYHLNLYLTSKNKRNTPDRLQLKKYSPKLRKHVVFTEVK
ncbi:MAG: 50S ribosomal protein L33 [Streptococcus sp.]|nr:50S ribosomal protein L33 [Streptococcus sp.]